MLCSLGSASNWGGASITTPCCIGEAAVNGGIGMPDAMGVCADTQTG